MSELSLTWYEYRVQDVVVHASGWINAGGWDQLFALELFLTLNSGNSIFQM